MRQIADTQMEAQQQLDFGQKAAGVSFNPSKDPSIDLIKQVFADIINVLNDKRCEPTASQGAKRYYSKAISYAEDAQMNAVKAITWAHE